MNPAAGKRSVESSEKLNTEQHLLYEQHGAGGENALCLVPGRLYDRALCV